MDYNWNQFARQCVLQLPLDLSVFYPMDRMVPDSNPDFQKDAEQSSLGMAGLAKVLN